jgi:hypothetical protein
VRVVVTRILQRTFVGLALVTVLIKLPAMLIVIPSIDYAKSDPPPAPRGAIVRPISPKVTELTFAFLKSKLRPGDRFYIAASQASVGTPHGFLDVWVPATFYFLPNVLTLDARDADVVFAIGRSPLPVGRYRLVARDGAGNRVLRRLRA